MSNKEAVVFYSWQSDDASTRSFVERSLKAAIKSLNSEPDLLLAPRMDKDTQGTTGAVDIADTILTKIEHSDIFVADISLVDKSSNNRHLVNQNVLFELGFAIGKKSNAFVILVANSDLDDIVHLPFDIRGRRVIQFSPSNDSKGTKLAAALQSALQAHIDSLETITLVEEVVASKQELTDAIDNKKPTRTRANKYFDELYKRYLASAPHRYKHPESAEEYGKAVYEAYLTTRPITEEFYDVISMAAEYKDEVTIIVAYKYLELITKYYDIVPEDNGQMSDISKEYYGLIVYELISIIFGCMAKDGIWDLMAQLRETKLNRPAGYDDSRTLDRFYYYPQAALKYFSKITNPQFAIPTTPLLQERFKSRDDILKTYVDGSLIIYLILSYFYPWPLGLLVGSTWSQYAPEYLGLFKQQVFIAQFQVICGEATLDSLQSSLFNKMSKNINNTFAYNHQNLEHLFKNVGIIRPEDIGSVSPSALPTPS